MSRRQSSLTQLDAGIGREIGSQYDNVKLVADNLATVNTLASNISQITTVNANYSVINDVYLSLDNINQVGPNITAINDVIANLPAITTANTNIIDIQTVAANIAGVNTTASNIAAILDASTQATNAAASAAAASTSETNAAASASTAAGWEVLAQKWAEELVDVVVEPGLYSAKHHATKAAESASAASTSASNASTSASNALASEGLAQQWAAELEDVVVSGGLYSALHYSAKSADSAAAALASQSAAATSATNASNSATSASNSAAAAATSEANAETFANQLNAGLIGTSTSSVTIADNTVINLVTQAGLNFATGHAVRVSYNVAPSTNYMFGTIISYNSGTGAISINIPLGQSLGSGTYTDWTIVIEYSSTSATPTFDTVDFNTAYVGASEVGRLQWNDTEGTLDLGLKGGNVMLQLGQETLVRIYNNTGATLLDGQVVYLNGSQGNRPTVALADADDPNTADRTIGVVTENILNGAEGFITTHGLVRNLNTTGYTEGDEIWLSSTAGAFTATPPIAPKHAVRIGIVTRVHATVGTIFVIIQRGSDFDQLHDVALTTPANNDLVQFNSVSGLWENKAASVAFNSIKQTATTTTTGVVELATTAEVNTGTDNTLAITPLGLASSDLQIKVNGIETGATADQTGAEIKALYEAEANTNAFTDAEQTKLAGIETGATADQTPAEIETAYNSQVAKVSAPEITAGTETTVRRYSVADVVSLITTHAPTAGPATTTTAGVVEQSTSGENIAGTSDVVFPSVAGVKEMIDTFASLPQIVDGGAASATYIASEIYDGGAASAVY